jgi:hypothetical protein
MKFQIFLAAVFAFVAVSAKKRFSANFQAVNLRNNANSCGNALAINSGYFGNANAFVNSDATNLNVVSQNQRNFN